MRPTIGAVDKYYKIFVLDLTIFTLETLGYIHSCQ